MRSCLIKSWCICSAVPFWERGGHHARTLMKQQSMHNTALITGAHTLTWGPNHSQPHLQPSSLRRPVWDHKTFTRVTICTWAELCGISDRKLQLSGIKPTRIRFRRCAWIEIKFKSQDSMCPDEPINGCRTACTRYFARCNLAGRWFSWLSHTSCYPSSLCKVTRLESRKFCS